MLSEYDMEIRYKTGKTNVPADMLSRIPRPDDEEELLAIDTSDKGALEKDHPFEPAPGHGDDSLVELLRDESLRERQERDEEFAPIIKSLRNGSEVPNYVLDNDLLYHISVPVQHDGTQRLQLAILK